jgi:hypothetical protein
MLSTIIAKIIANAVVSKTGEQKTNQSSYDFSVLSANVIIQPKFNYYFGFVFISLGIIAGIALMLVSVLAGLIMFVLFTGLGILVEIQYSNFRIEYNTDRIKFINTFGKIKEFNLVDITKVYISDQVVSVYADKRKFEFVPSCIGTQRFLFFLKEKRGIS